MGVRFPSVSSGTLQNPLPANATETVVALTPPLTITLDFAQIFIFWLFNITAGTGTTAVAFRVRRGNTVAGLLVSGVDAHTLAAGNQANVIGFTVDTPGAVAGQQYCLTLLQTGATGAGVANDIVILAFSL